MAFQRFSVKWGPKQTQSRRVRAPRQPCPGEALTLNLNGGTHFAIRSVEDGVVHAQLLTDKPTFSVPARIS